jgi:hypothetical protein
VNSGQTVFSQLLHFFPTGEFRQAVAHHGGNHRTRALSCYDQFVAMAFAQLTCRDSLRDIVACLQALGPRVYHAGLRGRVARSTLADANDRRDWRIYAQVAQVLITRARALYAGDALLDDLNSAVFALDSSVVSLCLKLCPWARFDSSSAAVKIHTLLDLRGSIPSVVRITPARVPDVGMLDALAFEPGATYIMDRAYLDFARLARIDAAGAFFVVRAKSNVCLRTVARRGVDRDIGLVHDHTVRTLTPQARRDYPGNLRRVRYYDAVHDNDLMFLSNHMELHAIAIADLYRLRWQVETFFRWIKQHLRIKAFYGTSDNAVRTQIWIALIVYLLVAIAKKHLHIDAPLVTILQVASISLFEKIPLQTALTKHTPCEKPRIICKQLELFDF